jgi:putative addiction module CopG family antidote
VPRQLTPQHEALIDQIVASGQYDDPDQVVTEAPRLLHEQDERQQWLRSKMATAAEHVKRGEVVEFTDELLDEIDREVDERLRRGDSPNPDVCP